jgi:outer membrane protein OmpA-like peptidoglycan-associated protein
VAAAQEKIAVAPVTGNSWKGQTGSAWSSDLDESSTDGFWVSYSDLMAGLLMIFVLASALYISNAIESVQAFTDFEKAMGNLCQQLEEDVKNDPDVEMNDCETGAITFRTAKWFPFNSTELQGNYRSVLQRFIPRWLAAVTEESTWGHVETLEFGGYADRATAIHIGNVDVSSGRAQAVMAFLLDDDHFQEYRSQLEERGIVVGYSDQDYPEECIAETCAAARRVVVKANLNEATVITELLRVLRGG